MQKLHYGERPGYAIYYLIGEILHQL